VGGCSEGHCLAIRNMKTAITISKAKAKAWKAFSLYIRLKDSVDGVNECYTCGKIFPIKKLQAGHGIGGRNNAVLFMEDIVKPQCVGCNMFANGRYAVFTRKLIDELGLDGYDEIVRQSNEIVKYTLSDYLELEKFYKNIVKDLA